MSALQQHTLQVGERTREPGCMACCMVCSGLLLWVSKSCAQGGLGQRVLWWHLVHWTACGSGVTWSL
jgi:hypothetical protein